MPVADDYLILEGELIERVRAEVPGLKAVLGLPDIAAARERVAQTPAAYVVYLGDQLPQGGTARAGQGVAHVIVQRWVVVIAVRNVRDVAGGSGARGEAGPLLALAVRALAGWQPPAAARPLKRVNAPAPVYLDGAGFFPLMFEAEVIWQ